MGWCVGEAEVEEVAFGDGVGIGEVVGAVGYGEGGGFTGGVGFVVEGDGAVEGSFADVAPLVGVWVSGYGCVVNGWMDYGADKVVDYFDFYIGHCDNAEMMPECCSWGVVGLWNGYTLCPPT